MLKFKVLDESLLEQAVSLALDGYNEECSVVNNLPRKDYKDVFLNLLSNMIKHNLGIVALDGNNVVGFITCYASINNMFGNVQGAFSPIHGHGAIKKDRSRIYSLLYQNASKKWVKEGILSHAIALYAHNKIAIDTFFRNGFGLRCVDAITSIDNEKLIYKDKDNIKMEEITLDKLECVLPLKNHLVTHLSNSPTFLPSSKFDLKKLKEQSLRRDSRFFTASVEDKVVGYVEIMGEGENFTCDDDETINICGAYVSLEYRGTGLYKSLISFMFDKLRKEKYKRCGVDFESINPTADRFWLKYFTPYTYSLVRRIDERMMQYKEGE